MSYEYLTFYYKISVRYMPLYIVWEILTHISIHYYNLQFYIMFNMCSKSFILVLVSVKHFGRFSLVKSIGILSLIIKSNHPIINLNYIVVKIKKNKIEEKKLCLKC